MKAKTKVVCWCAAVAVALATGAIVLMVQVECRERLGEIQAMQSDIWNNEVINTCIFHGYQRENPTDMMFYVERKTGKSGSAKEVYFLNNRFLVQVYRIKDNTIKDYRWVPIRKDVSIDDYENEQFVHLLYYCFKQNVESNEYLIQQGLKEDVPDMPDFIASSITGQTNVATTTLIFTGIYWYGRPYFWVAKNALNRLQWTWTTHEEPDVITDFCAWAMTVVDNPDYAKNNPTSWKPDTSSTRRKSYAPVYGKRMYPSYLRAIPLYTEEERAQAEDIPLVDYETAHKYLQYAVRIPYTLIPIPEKGSPFPELNKRYEPGIDKVRIKYDVRYEAGRDFTRRDPRTGGSRTFEKRDTLYFLVETFKGK